jgi:signal transduction histidine kinase
VGLLGDVWQRGQAVLLQGDDCYQRIAPGLKETRGFTPKAILTVPIRWQEQAVGILEASHSSAQAFTEELIPLMETIAAWTAIAIANAQQYKQLQRRLNESDALLSISQTLTETVELDEVLQLIVTQAKKIITNADWAVIHLVQPKTNHLELAAAAGLELEADQYRIEQGKGVAGDVMANGGVINVADMQTDPRRLPIDIHTNVHSLLVAPVESRRRRIGTISVQCATPANFTAEDERLLTILGVQAGMAYENARLFSVQRRAKERAERQRERMRHMARRVVTAQEEERARIARELHDESGQSLTSLKISLDLIRSAIPESLSHIRQSLDDVLELTDKTMSNIRLLSHNLRPPGLDVYGLDAALAGLCQDFETHTHLKIAYSGNKLPKLADLTALSLYRFAQEAITNAAKHAEATEVQVTLGQDSDMITLRVADNGRGFRSQQLDQDSPKVGVGLTGMVERLEMVNGRMQIESSPGQGSVITALVPNSVVEGS